MRTHCDASHGEVRLSVPAFLNKSHFRVRECARDSNEECYFKHNFAINNK